MNKKAILLVDDEINILNALNRSLITEDFNCFIATNGNRALEIMENNDIAVIVSDMRMPGMNGLELLKIIKEKYPYTVKIVLSGFAQLPQIIATINQVDIFKFILKPWDVENEFISIIREALEYHCFLVEREATRETQEKRYKLYLNILKGTDEKFIKQDKEIKNIKLVSQQVIQLMKESIGRYSRENKDVFMKDNLVYQLYQDYFNIIPCQDTYFTVKNLIESIKKLNFSKGYAFELKINSDINSNVEIHSNLDLLLSIISSILKIASFCKDIDSSLITLKFEKDSTVIEIRNSHDFNNYTDDDKNNFSKVIGQFMPLLFNICNIIDCEILKQESIESTNIRLLLKQHTQQ